MTGRPLPPAVVVRRDEFAAEVYAAAGRLRAAGLDDRVREVTIVRPIEHWAVAAIELACQALTDGKSSPAAAELDGLLARLAAGADGADGFPAAVRNVAGRVGPLPPGR